MPITELFPDLKTGYWPPSLLVMDTSYTPAIPVPLQLGDVNLDGFPDILAILAPEDVDTPDRIPRLALSVPCAMGISGCGQDMSGERGWQELLKGAEPLNRVRDARGISFIDMDEDVSCLASFLEWCCSLRISRARWTSWFSGRGAKGKGMFFSFRTISTMMRSSSKRLVSFAQVGILFCCNETLQS
jgi:hypothetical protein